MNKFDIYWYEFLFEDNKEDSKLRPALVLDVDIILPIAKITSHDVRTSNEYEILNWQEVGLSKPSVIRFDKKELILRSKLPESNYIGHLSQEDIDSIKNLHLIESLALTFKFDDTFGYLAQ